MYGFDYNENENDPQSDHDSPNDDICSIQSCSVEKPGELFRRVARKMQKNIPYLANGT